MIDQMEENLEKLKTIKYHADASMEDKIISNLKQSGLVKRKDIGMKKFLIAAAVIFIFFMGFFSQKIFDLTTKTSKAVYAVLVYEDESFKLGDLEEMALEYTKWTKLSEVDKYLLGGYELDYPMQNIPADTLKSNFGLMTGLFLFNAKSEMEVKRIINNHPHLKYNGRLSIRKIIHR
jgi:hypothetical protein